MDAHWNEAQPPERLKHITRKLSGVFKNSKAIPEGSEEKLRLTSVHHSGEHFGTMSIFLGRPQPTEYYAINSCILFTIKIDDLLEILQEGYESIENELIDEAGQNNGLQF